MMSRSKVQKVKLSQKLHSRTEPGCVAEIAWKLLVGGGVIRILSLVASSLKQYTTCTLSHVYRVLSYGGFLKWG